MRLLRSLGVVVGAVALTIAGFPGAAGAAPTAPYNAFTINGAWSFGFDPSNNPPPYDFGAGLTALANAFDPAALSADLTTMMAPFAAMMGPELRTALLGSL